MIQAKTVAKGSFWALFSNMADKLLSFIYTIIIARLLIADEVGVFYFVLSVVGVLYIFTDLGLVYALNRYVPYLYGRKEFGKLRSLIGLSYFGGGFLTIIFTVAVFLLSETIAALLNQPSAAPILQMMSIWLILKEIDNSSRGILRGRKKMMESEIILPIQDFMKIILTLIALYVVGFNAEALSIGFLISFALVLPLGLYYVLKDIKTWEKEEKKMTLREQLGLSKEVITFGLVVTFISTMWMFIQYTDKVMLGYLMDDALGQIAIYTMALGLAKLVLIFPTAVARIFFPVVSELYSQNNFEELNKILKTSMKWLVMLIIPLALVIGIFGENLLRLFYGDLYAQGEMVLLLFMFGLLIRSVFFLPQFVLSAMRMLAVEMKAVGVAAVSNILLNFLFIPLWGINGAALASLISFILLSVMIFYYSKKLFNFSFPRETYKPIIAGIAALIIMLLLKGAISDLINVYVSGIDLGQELVGELSQKMIKFVAFGLMFVLAVFIYFIALLLFKSFEEDELSIMEAALRKAKVPQQYISFMRSFLEARWLKLGR